MKADIEQLHSGTARPVHVPTGSISLDADLAVPAGAAGLVLFAHAGEECRHKAIHQLIAERLRDRGLGTLFFDLLSPGEVAEGSGRPQLRFNIGLLTQRLVCAAHWVGDEDEARHLPLGFLGTGTRAAAALVAAADLGRGIGAVVSLDGRPDLAGNALRRVKSPTLLIAGEPEDAAVALNREACEMLSCEKGLCVVRPGMPLVEAPDALEQIVHAAADWFLKHFQLFSRARFLR